MTAQTQAAERTAVHPYQEPRVGGHSPWGCIDYARRLAPGIVEVSTASHGGIYVAPELVAQSPLLSAIRPFTGSRSWWEEDCDWAPVALAFPQHFEPRAVLAAYRTVTRSASFRGVVVPPAARQVAESYAADIVRERRG